MGRTLQISHFPYIYSHQIDSTLQNITIDFCRFTIPDYQLPITNYQLPIHLHHRHIDIPWQQ
jgi:hypothetical protein